MLTPGVKIALKNRKTRGKRRAASAVIRSDTAQNFTGRKR